MTYLIEMVDFFHGLPPSSLLAILQAELAWIGFLPPSLDFTVVRDLCHVGIEVSACVFEVAEQVPLAVVELCEVDGVVADVGLLERLIDARPGIGVKLLVVFEFLRLTPMTEP